MAKRTRIKDTDQHHTQDVGVRARPVLVGRPPVILATLVERAAELTALRSYNAGIEDRGGHKYGKGKFAERILALEKEYLAHENT
jgi:hypothetical protein